MVIKIIDKRVYLPDITILQMENGEKLCFQRDRFFKEFDLNLYDAYLKYVRSDGASSKVLLDKKVDDNTLTLEFTVSSEFTAVSGTSTLEISFENQNGNLFNTEIFYIEIRKAITGFEGGDLTITPTNILGIYLKKEDFEREKQGLLSDISNKVEELKEKVVSGEVVSGRSSISNSAICDEQGENIVNTYQKKEDGKGLSSNDYILEDKEKVEKITLNGDGNSFLANDGSYKKVQPPYTAGTGIKINDDKISLTSSATSKINTIIKSGNGYKYLSDDGSYKAMEYTAVVSFEGLTVGNHTTGASWNETTNSGQSVGQWQQSGVTPVKVVKEDGKTVVQLMYSGAPYLGTRMFVSDIAFSGPVTKGWISVKKNKIYTNAETLQILGFDGLNWTVLADLTNELNGLKDEKFYDLTFTFEDKNYAGIQILYRAGATSNELLVDTLRFKDIFVDKAYTDLEMNVWKEIAFNTEYAGVGVNLPLNATEVCFEGFLFSDENKGLKMPTTGATAYHLPTCAFNIGDKHLFYIPIVKEDKNGRVEENGLVEVKKDSENINYFIKLQDLNDTQKFFKVYYKAGVKERQFIDKLDLNEIKGGWILNSEIFMYDIFENMNTENLNIAVDFESAGKTYSNMLLSLSLPETANVGLKYGSDIAYDDLEGFIKTDYTLIYINSRLSEIEYGEKLLEFLTKNGKKLSN
ncbi:MAG: hypothetical protein IKC71_03295 [Clostridia bacterium]|nr:hypothetical protein [Clostridia bacterium]